MKTSLHFFAPSDLSIGRIHIANRQGTVADWVATPDNRNFVEKSIQPGFYAAKISPAGLSPQSVVFEVKNGQANTVSLPSFSALAATGSDISFLGVSDQQAAARALFRRNTKVIASAKHGAAAYEKISMERVEVPPSAAVKRQISVGLEQENRSADAVKRFIRQTHLEVTGNSILIEIHTPPSRLSWNGKHVRLSTNIEGVRIEQQLLPMYRSGTTISITPSPLSSADVEIRVTPRNPKFRALLRTLQAGTPDEAEAVRNNLLRSRGLTSLKLLSKVRDPWAAILVGLLSIRFPNVFPALDAKSARYIVRKAPWACDSHIIQARQILSDASKRPESRKQAVDGAIAFLARAQKCGSPYFSYANQLFGEMIEGLNSFEGLTNAQRTQVDNIMTDWRKERPLQKNAGASFSWLLHDPQLLKKEGILGPNRRSSGLLQDQGTMVLFEGRIEQGRIQIRDGTQSIHESLGSKKRKPASALLAKEAPGPEKCPAMLRRPGPKDDPNLGRFSGKAVLKGFTLRAEFAKTRNRNWVSIALIVEGDDSSLLRLGDFAWFCLHPTFSRQWVKVIFRGRRAVLSVRAWGGFTVGVWLPRQQIELECNLALLPEAPRIIKER